MKNMKIDIFADGADIQSIKKLGKYLIKKYKINQKNILGHSDIAPTRKKDPGEKFPWKYLAKFGVGKYHSLPQKFFVKNRKKEISPADIKIFFNNLSKIGYSKISLTKSKKDKFFNFLIIAFQRRFRQELVNGKIDQECLLISKSLIKLYN